MNTSDRVYLDYNATAPLCSKFTAALTAGDIPFANPSSQHTSGKQAHKYIEEVKTFLFDHFNLSSTQYNILFHSGATEASNTFLANSSCFAYFNSDHACITKLAKPENSIHLDLKNDGSVDEVQLIHTIKEQNADWLHFTYVHNETGVINSLALAKKVQQQTGCRVYVDAVQSVGKIKNYEKLESGLDVYTFSGHKFGALKGIGFSFYKNDLEPTPLIKGGGQQGGIRSGTINIQGIASLKYALENQHGFEELNNLKKELVELLKTNSNIQVIDNDTNNTICFIHNKLKSDIMLIHFDLAGLDVSSGSACSSGSHTESLTLKSMGFGALAGSNIRISLGKENISQKDVIISKIKHILEKL